MGKCTEPGVLLQSDRYFNTPSAAENYSIISRDADTITAHRNMISR